jgi:hypothetical protein
MTTDLKRLKPKIKRKFFRCILADFEFRGFPQKIQQGYTYLGKVTITWRAYVLTNEELDALNKSLDKTDLGDIMSLIDGATDESLEQLQKDIDFFLEEKSPEEEKKKEKKKKEDSGTNPLFALFGYYNKEEKKKDEKKSDDKSDIVSLSPDNWAEKIMRVGVAFEADDTNLTLYDIYKKAHGMISFT